MTIAKIGFAIIAIIFIALMHWAIVTQDREDRDG